MLGVFSSRFGRLHGKERQESAYERLYIQRWSGCSPLDEPLMEEDRKVRSRQPDLGLFEP